MKRISFFLTLSLLILSFGLANAAQEVTIDGVDGSYIDGGPMLIDGGNATFHLRVTNTDKPGCKYAPAMSWAVTDNGGSGATWSGVSISYPTVWIEEPFPGIFVPKGWPDMFSQVFEDCFSCDGAGGDTIGVSGVAFAADTAFFYGLDAIVFDITIGPITGNGGSICLEYGGARNDGFDWGWNALDNATGGCDGLAVKDNFVGACYGVGTPPDFAPVFTTAEKTTVEGSHCALIQFNFSFEDPDPGAGPGPDDITPTATVGTISNVTATSATWSYMGSYAELGTPIEEIILLTEADNPSTTADTFNINLTNEAPQFNKGCGAALFAQNGVLKEHVMGGQDSCPGDPMNFVVVDAGGITGTVEFNGNVLEITGQPGVDAGDYTITVGINDGDLDGQTCEVRVTLSDGALYGVTIEKTHGTIQGTFATVDIILESTPPDLGGFNLLIAYDASALTFQGATQGSILDECGWEYFTYRYGADGNCNGGCPSGIVRLVGIAETNNGPNHPIPDCAFEGGTLASLSFLVSNDRTLECQYVPIRFWWLECGDNTITNADGTILYVASTVKEYPGDGVNLMDLYTAEFPSFIGPEAICLEGDKQDVLEDIDFLNGGIDIVCADSIDDRGDLNLDGLAYTIADAVMYSNYFVYGLTALVDVTTPNQYGYIPHYAASIAASDVNADGLALTVADLVYLIKVVVGDAQPYPKVTPVAANLTVGSSLSVDAQMGAAFVVLAGEQNPTNLTEGMEMKSAFDGENTRVLIWSQTGESFSGEFLGNVGDIISTELATADGAPVVSKLIPADFALGQNYPNPFNPTTTIELSLPTASDYTIAIYNVTGQLVQEISGTAEAGFVTETVDASNFASGVYFYKLTAGNFTDTKKMVLLK